jgi:hypothetical protein
MDRDVVLDLYDDVCDYWKEKLRNKYPLYFNKRLIVGKVYKFGNVIFQYYQQYLSCYTMDNFEQLEGFITSRYIKNHQNDCTEVTDNYLLQTFFEHEAKKRGFKDGSVYVDIYGKNQTLFNFDNLWYYPAIHTFTGSHGEAIFRDGVWAEII